MIDPALHRRSWWHAEMGLSALLFTQAVTLFVAIPLGPGHPFARMLLDACHLAFAVICIAVLTQHRAVQAMLLVSVLALSLPGRSRAET